MEETSAKTIRILRELAAMWRPLSIPGLMLNGTAKILETFFEDSAWQSSVMPLEETSDA